MRSDPSADCGAGMSGRSLGRAHGVWPDRPVQRQGKGEWTADRPRALAPRAVEGDGQRPVELTLRCRVAGFRLPSTRRRAPWPRWCSERPPPGAPGLCVPAGSWFRRSCARLCVRGLPCEPVPLCVPVPCGRRPFAQARAEWPFWRFFCQPSSQFSSRPSSRRTSPFASAPSCVLCSCAPPPSSRRRPSAPPCRLTSAPSPRFDSIPQRSSACGSGGRCAVGEAGGVHAYAWCRTICGALSHRFAASVHRLTCS